MSILDKTRARLVAEYEAEVRRTRVEPRGKRMTMARLLERSGLAIDRSTLHRKMYGTGTMTADEAAAIGAALNVRIDVVAKSSRAA